jgi:hypothetical protein
MAKKKDVSAVVAGMGVAMSIITSLAQKAKSKGLGDEDIHNLATPDGEHLLDELVERMAEAKASKPQAEPSDTYKVTVDNGLKLADMVAAGKYDYVNHDITPEHFPLDTRAPEQVEIRLVHLGRQATTEEVLAELEKRGLRPATLPELLALGAAHPDLQRSLSIVAFGSRWSDSGGRVEFSFLDVYGDGRRLSLYWDGPGDRWGSDFRFVAVCK